MIAIGICAGPGDRFESIAGPALAVALGPTATVWVLREQTSIAVAYNALIDRARQTSDLAGLVLIHDDVAVVDPEFVAKVTAALADPDVAVAGVVGGRGPRAGMPWFSCAERFGQIRDAAGVHVHDTTERATTSGEAQGNVDVDVVDGLMLALSPWAIANLHFEQRRYPPFHGYDSDICSQARAAGKRVVVTSVDIAHHTKGIFASKQSYTDWIRAGFAWRLRWQDLPPAGRVVLRIRHRAVPLEVMVRPSTRKRRNAL